MFEFKTSSLKTQKFMNVTYTDMQVKILFLISWFVFISSSYAWNLGLKLFNLRSIKNNDVYQGFALVGVVML